MADVRDLQREVDALRQVVRDLSDRVTRIEGALRVEAAPEVPAKAPTSPAVPVLPAKPTSRPVIAAIPPRPPLSTSAPKIDLESRIGSHWLNRVGIAAVLIGVSYFLKFAFDNNWIGAAGRSPSMLT